ncbi:hypothetical protein [Actinomadura sp. HBU206391]|uniref:hypothetical protein n=1 Tax=Actinomadura sp. HBU206391 TaxID=2731692 RepID=UPI0016501405|nr:hypothetical protein [Actinomadura sp. HBU206391]MBC6458174.1 hypothetical protein [Actinomadura sp. HBU206391]
MAVEHNSNIWQFSGDILESAVDVLADRGYEFRVAYASPRIGENVSTENAAYLCLLSEGDIDDLAPGPQLVYSDDGYLLANQDLIAVVAPLARDAQWIPSSRPDFWFLSYAPTLPEPIKIRTLFKRWPRAGNEWALSHDGREFFTSQNGQAIVTYGIAWATEYQYREERYRRPPLLVWGGDVINALMANEVQFADQPVYYLREPVENSS